ncbi:uncharacterized protein N7498_002009 [Penicillium cinerascens]|uniref:BED-type domain-containing protein n=1 Tax=Penicillium cinerascens TaxID=70096 RepID=A0A9W9N972_9EURO|nr:uncharacterized protein N7498_001984 [Penicillium cinerascens]XP_058311415.1 uncharacterized protein N7498_002009 [Penicillium cinerascens]KAJ5215577.1 hypothetical protein N7498_001984 [Penicillium cinerascens]KAJ5215602.1 hypothetical protein N7498_002009 [Penicillium cinerascens]
MSQSQASQFSDTYPSSIFEDNSLDNLSYLPSDGTTSFTPDSLFQQTPNPTPDGGFARPLISPPIPQTLERVGPTAKQKPFILWTEEMNDEFCGWWLMTEFGSQMKRNVFEKRRQADCWNHFHQVATIQDGSPKVMCKVCGQVIIHPAVGNRGTSSLNKHVREGVNCRRSKPSQDIRKLLQSGGSHSRQPESFTLKEFDESVISLITELRLPFQFVEHPRFHKLVQLASLAPSPPRILSAYLVRQKVQAKVIERQKSLLQMLPSGAKLSIALDCWTSPFRQAFMAITGYFIDIDWHYREILLGFEPLHGSHKGSDLSVVLLDLLRKHQIEDRVLTMTTDNASNNTTLHDSINEALDTLALPDGTPIVRIPCMAHVIQLSLNELLGKMEAIPKNDREEIEWTETEARSEAQRENKDIVLTLNKVRRLAVWVNRSPQRREQFLELQPKEPRLVLMQDVKTRWNSTFLMLQRAKKLQTICDKYCTECGLSDLVLTHNEWKQIDYLLSITQPFFNFTSVLSKTKDVTIHIVFSIYNQLFDHLEKSTTQLRRKKARWQMTMQTALEYATQKLRHYYAETDQAYGDLYAIATIMAPQNKLDFFSGKDWRGPYRKEYRESLEKYLEPYKQRHLETQPTSHGVSSAEQFSIVDQMGDRQKVQGSEINQDDELTQYLGSGTRKINPCVFWKSNQCEFPALASLARDVLSVPATGSGVERLFNTARDICHYRRGSLKSTTIQDLMMYLCTLRFDIESEQHTFIEEYLTAQEMQVVKEKKKTERLDDDMFDLISDTEEDPSAKTQPSQPPSRVALGKRPLRDNTTLIELGDEDEEDQIPLPDNSNLQDEGGTQRRTSGRVTKRSKWDDGEWEYIKP